MKYNQRSAEGRVPHEEQWHPDVKVRDLSVREKIIRSKDRTLSTLVVDHDTVGKYGSRERRLASRGRQWVLGKVMLVLRTRIVTVWKYYAEFTLRAFHEQQIIHRLYSTLSETFFQKFIIRYVGLQQ